MAAAQDSVCYAVQQNVPINRPDPTTAPAQGSGTCARASLLSWRRQKQRAPEAERLQNPSDSQAAELRVLQCPRLPLSALTDMAKQTQRLLSRRRIGKAEPRGRLPRLSLGSDPERPGASIRTAFSRNNRKHLKGRTGKRCAVTKMRVTRPLNPKSLEASSLILHRAANKDPWKLKGRNATNAYITTMDSALGRCGDCHGLTNNCSVALSSCEA